MLAITKPDEHDCYMTPQQLADRWLLDATSLANARSRGEGLPFVKLPTGAVRYRMADVLRAELQGLHVNGAPLYPVSWNRLRGALKACPDLARADIESILAHLRERLSDLDSPAEDDLCAT